jgi:hypothetical protein
MTIIARPGRYAAVPGLAVGKLAQRRGPSDPAWRAIWLSESWGKRGLQPLLKFASDPWPVQISDDHRTRQN